MNFRDKALTCAVCGKRFVFTVTEQRRLFDAGQEIHDPTDCPTCRLRDPDTGRWSGRIKWFSYEKGYGFIVKPNSDEVFFHRSQVVDTALESLQEGAAVTFEEVATDRGAEARQVTIAAE
jgi:CspA family cold shock protein